MKKIILSQFTFVEKTWSRPNVVILYSISGNYFVSSQDVTSDTPSIRSFGTDETFARFIYTQNVLFLLS